MFVVGLSVSPVSVGAVVSCGPLTVNDDVTPEPSAASWLFV